MNFYWLILGILSVWRITHLFNAEDGPWDVFYHFRRLAGHGFLGRLLDCFHCLSLWISVPFAYFIGQRWEEKGLLWLSFSAGAILINQLLTRDHSAKQAEYSEDKEEY